MPDETPHGFPYPVGTDRVMDGDNAIQSLAEAVDNYVYSVPRSWRIFVTTNGVHSFNYTDWNVCTPAGAAPWIVPPTWATQVTMTVSVNPIEHSHGSLSGVPAAVLYLRPVLGNLPGTLYGSTTMYACSEDNTYGHTRYENVSAYLNAPIPEAMRGQPTQAYLEAKTQTATWTIHAESFISWDIQFKESDDHAQYSEGGVEAGPPPSEPEGGASSDA